MSASPVKGTEPFLTAFERLARNGWSHSPAWIQAIRKEGIAAFASRGFPTVRDEDWRFTSVDRIVQLPFNPVQRLPSHVLTPEKISSFLFGNLKSSRLVFLNGHFSKDLSSILSEKGGVRVESLSAALRESPGELEKSLARYALCAHHPFASLNTAFFSDGAFIQVPPREELKHPIHLIFIALANENGATLHPRNLVLMGEGSKATVIESYVAFPDSSVGGENRAAYFTNALTELVMDKAASLEHCKFQDEDLGSFHVATIHAHLEKDSRLMAHSVSAGARLSRNNIVTTLDGPGIECVLNGLYMVKGDQLVDHHMIVDHAKPHCASHEYYNGILDGNSRGVFHGRILVRKDAQKTDAKQTNKNLLLSDQATVDTKPQLEIYADDVKCTHGATVGQLNEEAIFYLQSRGIGEVAARKMLVHAFASEILNRIQNETVRDHLDQLLWSRMETK